MRKLAFIVSALAVCAAISLAHAGKPSAAAFTGSPYLFVWAGDEARKSNDFLAVIDANPSSDSYGRIVNTVPVGITGSMPHHTEYEFPQSNLLFANGWVAGHTFIFDLSQPLKPRIATQFQDRAGYSFPHSFVRLPHGNVLATFQSHDGALAADGGLAELDNNGTVVRSASALDPAVDKDLIWPYSLQIVLQMDRVVSTSTPMGWPDWGKLPAGSWTAKKMNDQVTAQVQIWRLSDLHLLNTVYTFPGGDSMHTICSVPVVVGHYWIQTVAALPGLIALDISHPEKPVEVSRLVFDSHFPMPHWLAADRKSDRLVVTGDMESWVLVARFDAEKGKLSLDQSFRQPGAAVPGISFDRQEWPHGKAGRALVHGALFGPQ
jgi:hypothetical protein